jgi:hypothetical protein
MIWKSMKKRCCNINTQHYKYYGGRGIKVCDRWLSSFENFLEDMGEKPKGGYSLERINNELGYSIDNCKWAKAVEQMNNTRHNKFVTYQGETMTISQWSRNLNIDKDVLYSRLGRLNWSVEKSLATPPRKKVKMD